MTKFVLDSWSWIEYMNASKAGVQVKDIITNEEVYTHVITIAEVVSKYERNGKDGTVPKAAIASLSRILTSNDEDALATGILHAGMRQTKPNFSLADAFVLQAARRLHLKVLTGDPDFEGIDEAVMLEETKRKD